MHRGIVGRASGTVAGYHYSPALKNHGGTWTDANLDSFLKSPMAFAPGGKMYISVAPDENRKAIIGYLKTLK